MRPIREAEPKTILLVDDDAVIRGMAQEYLTEKGFRVLTAGSAEEALRQADEESGPIDILVSDITLPGRSGREIAENLAKRTPPPRFLFMSGYEEDTVVLHGTLNVDYDFLQKPFGLDLLERRIRASLGGRDTMKPEWI